MNPQLIVDYRAPLNIVETVAIESSWLRMSRSLCQRLRHLPIYGGRRVAVTNRDLCHGGCGWTPKLFTGIGIHPGTSDLAPRDRVFVPEYVASFAGLQAGDHSESESLPLFLSLNRAKSMWLAQVSATE
ncbi:MAG: hypothetical protein AAF438_00775 [Pseudomonadota bacterium]